MMKFEHEVWGTVYINREPTPYERFFDRVLKPIGVGLVGLQATAALGMMAFDGIKAFELSHAQTKTVVARQSNNRPQQPAKPSL